MNLALTGHRPKILGFSDDKMSSDYKGIGFWNELNIEREIFRNNQKSVTVYCGMANGCDISFGLMAYELKKIVQ